MLAMGRITPAEKRSSPTLRAMNSRSVSPGGSQAHADDVDAPVFGGADLLLQRSVALELPVVVGEDAGHRSLATGILAR